MILYEHSMRGNYGGSGSELRYTWLIVFLVSLALILVVISSLLLICRRLHHGSLKQKSIGGYLAANTAESFHSQVNNGGSTLRAGGGEPGCNISSMINSTSISNNDHGKYCERRNVYITERDFDFYLIILTTEFHNNNNPFSHLLTAKTEQSLWMDRRWNGADYERDSNSSEKKLLPVSTTLSAMASSVKDNNNTATTAACSDENEYAYIDRKSLSTFSGIHTLSNGIEQQQQQQQHISPEPYATTDLLRSSASVASNVAGLLSHDKNINLRNGGSQTQLYAVRFHLYSVTFWDIK